PAGRKNPVAGLDFKVVGARDHLARAAHSGKNCELRKKVGTKEQQARYSGREQSHGKYRPTIGVIVSSGMRFLPVVAIFFLTSCSDKSGSKSEAPASGPEVSIATSVAFTE